MATYGLTDTGFEIPTLQDILDEKQESYEATYGDDFQAVDTNLIWQNAAVEAERELKVWQVLESIYYSQTLSGAEGIYLDNVLGQRGVYRNDASAGYGYATIVSNSNVSSDTELASGALFSASNSITYELESDTAHRDRCTGFYITMDDFGAETIDVNLYVVSTSDSNTYSLNGSFDSSDNSAVTDFFDDVVSFITEYTSATTDECFVTDSDTDDVALCIGFAASGSVTGISDPTEMYFDTDYGLKAGTFYVVATETGYNQLETGGISSVSPTSSNYEEVTNVEAFSSGSDVESDTEYKARFNSVKDTASGGTKTSVLSSVLAVDDVESAIIYDNATSEDTTYADAFTFKTVVTGGATADIAQAIYDTKPINTGTSGDLSYTVDTEDGSTETIYFSRTSEVIIDISIEYSTTSNLSLTSDEQDDILEDIETLIDATDVGGTIFNAQIAGTIFSALDSGRLTALTVYMKASTDEDTEYSTDNYTLAFDEVASTSEDNITYTKS